MEIWFARYCHVGSVTISYRIFEVVTFEWQVDAAPSGISHHRETPFGSLIYGVLTE